MYTLNRSEIPNALVGIPDVHIKQIGNSQRFTWEPR